MSKKHCSNSYDRGQNKRARERKERAKAKHFGKTDNLGTLSSLKDIDIDEKNVWIVSALIAKGVFQVFGNSGFYNAKTDKGLASSFSNNLVIGDKVILNEENLIISKLPRSSYLARLRGDGARFSSHSYSEHVIAANIDAAVIVATTKEPDFRARLIDRYLILCQHGGVEPIICLNKCDLTSERSLLLDTYRRMGISVIETSTVNNTGLEALQDVLKGKTVVFVGNSGVGKSTLINRINPNVNIETQTVSEKGEQGRHTTTSSNLYDLDRDTFLIDTPGVRSLGISGISAEELKYYFREFEIFEGQCKYRDCSHSLEPDCAVKSAVLRNEISVERYESYLRILQDETGKAIE